MMRATETRVKPRSLAVLALTLTLMAGCEEALSPDGASEEATDNSAQNDGPTELFPNVPTNKRDAVEAPEVFEVTEAGLWDGRPSLGGIWVAHPDVTQPERVVIKNPGNNKTITGALFRREKNLPGPALQLSSEAAQELGILAGAPTKVQVIALRRKPVEEPKAEPEETPATETAKDDKTPAAQETKPQDDSTETAATETEKPAKRKWWQKKEPAAAAGAAAAATAAATDEAAEATTEAAEQAVEAAPQAAPTATLSDPTVTPPEEKPAKRKWWQKKDKNEITETPLDPIAGAAAAIESADPTPVSAPETPEKSTSRSLTKPYIQVGTFNVEANAKSAVSKIERNGLTADIRELKSGENTVWRVLVGPAATRSERNAMQSDVKDLGFTDAFTVKN